MPTPITKAAATMNNISGMVLSKVFFAMLILLTLLIVGYIHESALSRYDLIIAITMSSTWLLGSALLDILRRK